MLDLAPATRRTAALIGAITDDQLGGPTPCPAYTLGDLLEHVSGLAVAFTAAARKEPIPSGDGPPPPGDASRLDADWRASIPAQLAALAEAWRDGEAWDGMTAAGGIEMPGEIAGLVALDEVLVHGWDIAKASGQAYEADPMEAELCLRTMGPPPGEERPEGDDVAFGRPVEVADDAAPLDRLVAALGRDPSWSPPAA